MACRGLRFWLYAKIGNENYPGLVWENHDEMTFRLPWVTETEPNWEKYYKLFHEWSERDSKPSCMPSEVKSKFRNAVNHSKYLKKIKKMDQQMGSYIIYKFVKASREDLAGANQQPDGSRYQVEVDNDPKITVHQGFRYQVPMDTANDESVPNTCLVHNYGGHANNEPTPCDDKDCEDMVMSSIPSLDNEQIALNKLFAMGISGEDLASCEYSIEYMGRIQRTDYILNMQKNSKFIYGSLDNACAVESVNINKNSPYFSDQLYELPEPLNNASESMMTILKNMNTGISVLFDVKDLFIKVVRHCRTHVFSFDVVGSNDSPTFLIRDQPYPIFSYRQFLFDYTSSLVPEITPPDSKIELIAGVRPTEKGAVTKGVKITLKPCGALKLLNCDMSSLQDLCLSLDSSSLDRELRALTLGGSVAGP